MHTSPDAPHALPLTADDGYSLTAQVHPAQGPERARIVVAGATAVPQRFYRPFAAFAAQRGYTTLTLDYRGIGLSRPASLRGFEMKYLDWARRDLPAAIDAFARPDVPLFYVGHSYGGHAFGLLPNPEFISRVYTFGTGAGWHGWMPPRERVRVLALWHVVGPLLVRTHGYLAWKRLGLGEDLPLGVYRDWKRWCAHPRYVFDVPELRDEVTRLFDRIRTPIVAANALDDLWALPASRDAFMAGYRHAALRVVDIDPNARGIGPIGHMGYFHRRAQPLWGEVLAWFDDAM